MILDIKMNATKLLMPFAVYDADGIKVERFVRGDTETGVCVVRPMTQDGQYKVDRTGGVAVCEQRVERRPPLRIEQKVLVP